MSTLQFSSFVILLFFFFLIVIRYWKQSRGKANLPPGPKPIPVLGNLHQLVTASGLPHHALSRICKKHGPVVKIHLGQLVAVVISSPEAAEEVFKTKEISFMQRPQTYALEMITYNNSSMFLSPCNDYWRNLRKVSVLELLSNNRVQSFRSIREEEVRNLVGFISSNEGGIINLGDRIFRMTIDVIFRSAFGYKCRHKHKFISLIEEILVLSADFGITDFYPSLKFLRFITGMNARVLKVHEEMDRILEDIIAEHKKNDNIGADNEELLETLLRIAECNDDKFCLTIMQVKAVIQDIFFAASETSATSMEWAMSELLKNPRVMEKAKEEIRGVCKGKAKIEETDIQKLHYLKSIIKETFRLHPPAPLNTRVATERSEISGYTIPATAKIVVNNYAIGRDPKVWNDPESFQPERFEGSSVDFKGNHYQLLPFGGGKRICPGISFATTVIELGLAQLLYHFDFKLPYGMRLRDLDMTEKYRMTSRRKENLKVIATTCIPFQNETNE